MLPYGVIAEHASLGVRWAPKILDDKILRYTKIQEESRLLSVFRDISDEGRIIHDTINNAPLNADRSASPLSQTCNAFGQLALAIAIDSCYSHDLARVDGEIEIPQRRETAVVVRAYIFHDQNGFLPQYDWSGFPLHHDRTPNHHTRQFKLRCLTGWHSTHHATVPDDSNSIRNFKHLAQFVTDENDRASLLGQLTNGPEELLLPHQV